MSYAYRGPVYLISGIEMKDEKVSYEIILGYNSKGLFRKINDYYLGKRYFEYLTLEEFQKNKERVQRMPTYITYGV